ncbi:hypothetical protein, partial [Schnuerera sp.]|uniref:hypothetical protein n=1 Tax=Schnuerera sp. TaxID=2794844 RepID=UPI002BBB79DA
KLDPAGRTASLGILMQNIGLAVGPPILGYFLLSKSYIVLSWYGIILYLICIPLVIPLAKFTDTKMVSE